MAIEFERVLRGNPANGNMPDRGDPAPKNRAEPLVQEPPMRLFKNLERFNAPDYLMVTYLISWLDHHWDNCTSTIPMVLKMLYMGLFEFEVLEGSTQSEIKGKPSKQLFVCVKGDENCTSIPRDEWECADTDKRRSMLAKAVELLHTEWLREFTPTRKFQGTPLKNLSDYAGTFQA